MIIFGPPRTIADVKALVRKFDIPLDDPSRQSTIHVRPLDYADAKKLAATLSALATGNKAKQPVRRAIPPAGTGAVGGVAATRVDEPLSVADLGDDVKIAPEESSNSLLITGSHAAYQTINSLIRKLDIRRSQVYVEADILDISMDDGFNFGTSVFAGRGGPQSSSIATTWEAGALGPLIAAQATQGATGTSAVTNTAAAKEVASVFAEDLTIGVLSGKEIEIAGLGKFRPGALIRMLKKDGNVRILSSPSMMTLNNEDSSFTVGQKIYFQGQDTIPTTTGQVMASKPEKEDIDLTLGVKPNISHSNYVTMQITLEANSLGPNLYGNLPSVNKRKSKQLVTVKNAQTVVISGMVQTLESKKFNKIPLLGDIPIIGWLFRNSEIRTTKSNLMIFLTPHIIHGADDMAAVYASKLEDRDQYLASIYGSKFAEDDFYKMLPTREDGTYVASDMDKNEKERRESLLRQLYENSAGPQPKPKKPEDEKGLPSDSSDKGLPKDDSPVYVPLSGEGGGGDMGSGGGGDIAPPPPPEPAPEVDSGG